MKYFTNDNILELFYNRRQWWYATCLDKMWMWFDDTWTPINFSMKMIEDCRETNRLEMLMDGLPELKEELKLRCT